MKKFIKYLNSILITILFITSITFGAEHHTSWNGDQNCYYEEVNNNEPYFSDKEKNFTTPFELYSELDNLGRVGVCFANIDKSLMPKKGEKRESINKVFPTGWKYKGKSNNNKYDIVSGKYIYNRSHLIGWQLTAENANEKNLFTGTRFCNAVGMLDFENRVANYLKNKKYSNNHVLYRVTPIFENDNLICEGVRMEAYSIEDNGEGICFNVFCYNVQPGIKINYKTGENYLMTENDTYIENEGKEKPKETFKETTTIDLTQTNYEDFQDDNIQEITLQETIQEGIQTIRIIWPIIVATLILVFIVLFTNKILKKINSKKKKK